jgi:hypothetical protein
MIKVMLCQIRVGAFELQFFFDNMTVVYLENSFKYKLFEDNIWNFIDLPENESYLENTNNNLNFLRLTGRYLFEIIETELTLRLIFTDESELMVDLTDSRRAFEPWRIEYELR